MDITSALVCAGATLLLWNEKRAGKITGKRGASLICLGALVGAWYFASGALFKDPVFLSVATQTVDAVSVTAALFILLGWRSFCVQAVALGAILNLLVVFANDNRMPVWSGALDEVGRVTEAIHSPAEHFVYEKAEEVRLAVLSDCLPYEFASERSVASLGDIFIFIAAIAYIPLFFFKRYVRAAG